MNKNYFRILDIFRFFAFLLVFISHISLFMAYDNNSFFYTYLKDIFLTHGNIGVNFFFTLSGFLITYLLLKEKASTGDIQVKKFFVRRALRIWPVYFITLFFGLFVLPSVIFLATKYGFSVPSTIIDGTELKRLPWFLLFLENFDAIYNGPANFTIAVLWSISVEEQFYLVWPWVIRYVPLKHLLKLFISLIVASTIYRYIHVTDFSYLRNSTFSLVSDLVSGSLLAYMVLYIKNVKNFFEKQPRKEVHLITLFLISLFPLWYILEKEIILYSTRVSNTVSILYTILPLLFSYLFALVIGRGCYGGKNTETKFNLLLEYLGQRSYGLYAYHCIAILFIKATIFVGLLNFLNKTVLYLTEISLTFTLTVILSILSFKYIETPILKMKEKFI